MYRIYYWVIDERYCQSTTIANGCVNGDTTESVMLELVKVCDELEVTLNCYEVEMTPILQVVEGTPEYIPALSLIGDVSEKYKDFYEAKKKAEVEWLHETQNVEVYRLLRAEKVAKMRKNRKEINDINDNTT